MWTKWRRSSCPLMTWCTHLDSVTCDVCSGGHRLVTVHHLTPETLQSSVSQPRLSRGEQSLERRRIQQQFETQSVMDALTRCKWVLNHWIESICKHDVMNLARESDAYLDVVTGINQNNEMRLFSVNKIIELNNLWWYPRSLGGLGSRRGVSDENLEIIVSTFISKGPWNKRLMLALQIINQTKSVCIINIRTPYSYET